MNEQPIGLDAIIAKYARKATVESARYVRASDVVEDLRYMQACGTLKPDNCGCEWDASPPNIACLIHRGA